MEIEVGGSSKPLRHKGSCPYAPAIDLSYPKVLGG